MEQSMSPDAMLVVISGILQVGWIAVIGFHSKRIGELHRDVRDLAVKVAHIEGEWAAKKQED